MSENASMAGSQWSIIRQTAARAMKAAFCRNLTDPEKISAAAAKTAILPQKRAANPRSLCVPITYPLTEDSRSPVRSIRILTSSYCPFPFLMALITGRNSTALMATPSPIPQTYLQKETTKSVMPTRIPGVCALWYMPRDLEARIPLADRLFFATAVFFAASIFFAAAASFTIAASFATAASFAASASAAKRLSAFLLLSFLSSISSSSLS